MARVLLGVTGGIAAYKAVELARLAIKAGHTVRVVQTPASLSFVGKATFEGITGAPGPHRRVRARPGPRRLPRRSRAGPRGDLAPRARRARGRLRDRAGVGQHARQARQRLRRQPRHHRGARRSGAARDRAGHERRACGATPRPRRTSRRCACAAPRSCRPARASSPRRASGARAASPSRRTSLPRSRRPSPRRRRVRAALARRGPRARHGRRHARGDRLGSLRRQPLLRADGLRGGGRGCAPRAPRSPSWRRTSHCRATAASSTSTWRARPSSNGPPCAPSITPTCS